MKLQLAWARPLLLRDARRNENLIYTVDHRKLPKAPGIYVFGRRFGRNFEALYVGKAGRIPGRVRVQLNNLPLMMHLKKAKIGKRVVFPGRFVPKPGNKSRSA